MRARSTERQKTELKVAVQAATPIIMAVRAYPLAELAEVKMAAVGVAVLLAREAQEVQANTPVLQVEKVAEAEALGWAMTQPPPQVMAAMAVTVL